MKKLLLSMFCYFTLATVFAQNKAYTVENNDVKKVKVQSEFLSLEIQKSTVHNNKAFKKASFIPLLIDQIPKIPEYVSTILKRQKRKYTATYEAKNTLTFASGDSMPKLVFKKYIIYDNNENATAVELELSPKQTVGNYFSFYVTKANVFYSSAKLKKKYTHLTLLVEITATYNSNTSENGVNKSSKSEVKSAALKVPVKVGTNVLSPFDIKKNLSDAFPVENLVEISVKVTEVNPFQVKLEEIESFAEDFKEPIADFFKKLGESLAK